MQVDDYGPYTLAAGQSHWYYIYPNIPFGPYMWQRMSVYPTPYNTPPAKVTILEEDWEVDESRNNIAWVLVRNTGPFPVEFGISSITLPQ